MGKKVKKCPGCGLINDGYAFFCANPECRESLMYVAAVSSESLPQKEPEDNPAPGPLPSPPVQKGKKCPRCGFINDEYALFCENPGCRENLLNIKPERIGHLPPKKEREGDGPFVAPPTPYTAQLECLSQPGFVFEVKDHGIIGRQGDIDVSCLENCLYISRLHARFIYAGGKWHLENLSDTNKTMVNNCRVPKGSRQVLSDGDRITLANSAFVFKTM